MEPWCEMLRQGETGAAWDLFIERYRRLLLATVRSLVDGEDVLDAFAHVCAALSADDVARLRRYTVDEGREARFSTWLVVVARNLTIDWVRKRDGRPRVRPPADLSPVQRSIFRHVFTEGRSHVEAYELVRAEEASGLGFGPFMKELAETYRVVERSRNRGAMHYFGAGWRPPGPGASPEEAYERAELRARLQAALQGLPADVRLAVQLFVVDGMPAADVARTVGWPNAKAVYNRVHRALRSMRAELGRRGLGMTDL